MDTQLPEKKSCSKCKLPKCLDEFPPRRDRPSRESRCKECRNDRSKRYYADHIEERRANGRKRYHHNREARIEYTHQYRKKNPEKIKARRKDYGRKHRNEKRTYMQKWRELKKEHRAIYRKKYRIENIHKINEYEKLYRQVYSFRIKLRMKRWRLKQRKHLKAYTKLYQQTHKAEIYLRRYLRRTKFLAAIVEKINPMEIAERDGWKCHLCHRRVWRRSLSLDHLIPIVHGGPHTKENVAIAHRRCNSRRGAGRIPAQLRLFG